MLNEGRLQQLLLGSTTRYPQDTGRGYCDLMIAVFNLFFLWYCNCWQGSHVLLTLKKVRYLQSQRSNNLWWINSTGISRYMNAKIRRNIIGIWSSTLFHGCDSTSRDLFLLWPTFAATFYCTTTSRPHALPASSIWVEQCVGVFTKLEVWTCSTNP